jgi:hypothetical protein
MRKVIIFFFSLVLVLGIFSCKKNKKYAEAQQIVKEWTGKQILFPDDYSCFIQGKDTAVSLCSGLLNREYKILLYVDSTGCSGCRLKLFQWQQLIAETDSLFEGRLSFLLFFQPKNTKEMRVLFKRDQFDYPVFIDTANTLEQLNHFPSQPEYQCFLLDKDNKVLMLGNPVLNPQIWELYKQMITN